MNRSSASFITTGIGSLDNLIERARVSEEIKKLIGGIDHSGSLDWVRIDFVGRLIEAREAMARY